MTPPVIQIQLRKKIDDGDDEAENDLVAHFFLPNGDSRSFEFNLKTSGKQNDCDDRIIAPSSISFTHDIATGTTSDYELDAFTVIGSCTISSHSLDINSPTGNGSGWLP